MQVSYLLSKSYQETTIDQTIWSKKAIERMTKLDHYRKMRKEKCSEQTALEVLGISRPTLYRWRRRFKYKDPEDLEDKSRRPINFRKPCWDSSLERAVLVIRIKCPVWGKDKIAAILKKDYQIETSVSTTGRILSKLIASGKVKPADFYSREKRPQPRVFTGHAQRWTRDLPIKTPGDLVQVDHMSVFVDDKGVKHFRSICPITRITAEEVYTAASSKIGAEFLEHMMQSFPFPVRSIQVDGGSEFMGDFEIACEQKGIPLYVLPPRSPELNGKVERSNRTLRSEFYDFYPGSVALHELRPALKKYVEFYNKLRPHQALGQKSPYEYYEMIKF